MNSSAGDLLFMDFVRLGMMLMGYGGGHLLVSYQKEKYNFGVKKWQKAIIYLEGLIISLFITFHSKEPTGLDIERGVLMGLPALAAIMVFFDKKESKSMS